MLFNKKRQGGSCGQQARRVRSRVAVCGVQAADPQQAAAHPRRQRCVSGGLTWTCCVRALQLYRGTLQEAEDNMNCSMTNVTMTGRDGSITTLEQVFIRGGLINFVIIPDILKNAPMFKRIDPKQGIRRGKGVGIGRATVNRARSVYTLNPKTLYRPVLSACLLSILLSPRHA